ncbi:teichoic acid biosynthesis protein [Desulfosporosinus orientis DSM 765]|uniref:N-acetylglucosaminyldiphosphoundecaprenol N-acetyl-beta-D-mannosaminyltransferase n=1 Tax=Desulfosporosinus orientis (strain ATCC 19365 / DSM 765 / NCIMB 8382 / VKM B-1628 / Singapore I) TaxID=768706 RepID=G7WGF3_DESOD|nr:WecB/TagA/CpsF family glycosyltransferase [Desulfosporosinus orientis]AET70885.1 teichoic acid biosynthesis protein [Desulfosporosinus orientis DSM 765]
MRVDVLGITIDTYSMSETVEQIFQFINNKSETRVVTANPEMIYASGQDQNLKRLINSADIVTADGIGVVWAARQLGTPLRERVTGIDLLQALFPIADRYNLKIFFLGGRPGVALRAGTLVNEQYPGIVWDEHHGYFGSEEEEDVLEKIKCLQPDLLLVGLGSPRQDYWIAEHSSLATVSIGVGGSFDALAGTALRAPKRIRDMKMEWLYRLWKEPWRWRRQRVLPLFVLKVLHQKYLG